MLWEKTLSAHDYELFYGGQWQPASGGGFAGSLDPFSGEDWARFALAGRADVDAAVRTARDAFETGPWRTMTGKERGALMRRLADIIARDAKELALIETRDNGKLLREMQGQWQALPDWFIYFSGLADKITGKTIPTDRNNYFCYTVEEPLGVIAAITPWNSPVMLMAFKLAPALAAGCTFVVKPSEHAPISVLEFAKRVKEAGFPDGVFNVVTGFAEAGSALVEHPMVDKVAFTGSNKVGAAIAASAGSQLTRVALELGGKSPNIVFEDADLEAAANGVVAGIFAATGQTCIAGARLLAHRSIIEPLTERLAARARTIKLGDPKKMETEMGPVATRPQFAHISAMVERAVEAGAHVVTGAKPAPTGELFYEPTILADVEPQMEVYREEVFGPVLSIVPFDTEEDAVRMANDTRYGLAAGVWTQSIHRAHRMANSIRAGMIWVNCYRINTFFSPFGGFKKSGWGRENGPDAIKEYTDTKTVWVELSGATRDPFVLG